MFRLAQIVAYYAKKQLKKIAFYGLLLELADKLYQKCHSLQNYTCWKVAPTKLFNLAEDDKMYNFLFTQKNQETFTQTSAQAYILNIEVFDDILIFA